MRRARVKSIPPECRGEIKLALDASVLSSLGPMSIGLAGLFALFIVFNLIDLPRHAVIPVVIWDAAMVIAFTALWLVLRYRHISVVWSNWIGAGMALLTLSNVLLTFTLLRDPFYTFYVAVIIGGTGALMLDRRALISTLVLIWGAWTSVALYTSPLNKVIHYGFTLISVTVLSVVIHLARVQVHRRLELMRINEEERKRHDLRRAHEETHREVTERVKVVRENKSLEQQLLQAQKMEAIGTLAGGVAHDMNNVLATVMGLASAAREETAQGGALREDINGILEASRRGRALTRNLLGFARRGKFRKEPLSLLRMVKDVRRLLDRTLPKGIELEIDPQTERAFVEGDVDQLSNVLMNLAVNAADAMKGKGTLTFTLDQVRLPRKSQPSARALPGGPYVRLAVRDTGAGMDAETLRQAFEPFYTTKPRGQGTGLGLSMVYGTLRNHGGSVHLASAPGRGTTVTLYLPELDCPLSEPHTDELPVIRPGSGTVLLVDDEELILVSGARLMRKLGYTVLVAHSGRAAVELFLEHQRKIDLVMVDLNMPELDGIETFRRIRSIDPQARVLLSSGYVRDAAQTQELVAMGMLGFIQKPYDLTELSASLARVDVVEEAAEPTAEEEGATEGKAPLRPISSDELNLEV
jgi:two-component system, cell cycle sensor histidine kinase and response regulator CckA